MKKRILFLLILISHGITVAQVYPYTENFNTMPSFANPTGWTCTIPGFQVYPNHGNGSQGLTKNMFALGPVADSAISPLIGPLTTTSVLSIQYRIMQSNLYPCCSYVMSPGDGIDIFALDGASAILLYNIDNTNHVADTGFQTLQLNVGSLAGGSGNLMIKVRRGPSSDFFADFDNISVTNASTITSKDASLMPQVFPNPVKNGDAIQLKNIPDDIYNIRLISASGGILNSFRHNLQGNGSLPLPANQFLENGVYFLQLTSGRNNFLLRFVVKN